jgi:hypothetical protein
LLKKSDIGGSDKMVSLDEDKNPTYWSSNANKVNQGVVSTLEEIDNLEEVN